MGIMQKIIVVLAMMMLPTIVYKTVMVIGVERQKKITVVFVKGMVLLVQMIFGDVLISLHVIIIQKQLKMMIPVHLQEPIMIVMVTASLN